MAALPMDPDAANILGSARADAAQMRGEATPGYNPLSKPAIPALSTAIPAASKGDGAPHSTTVNTGSGGSTQASPATPEIDPTAVAPVPDAQAQDTPEFKPSAEPQIDPNAIKPVKPGFFDNTSGAVGNGVMQGFAQLGRAALLASSAVDIGVDKIHSAFTGKDETGLQEAAFKAIDDLGNSAVSYWTPDAKTTGTGASVLGSVANVAPSLMLGPTAAPAALAAQATADSGIDSVQQGIDAKTAGIIATIHGLTGMLGLKSVPDLPALIPRIAASIGLNLSLNASTDVMVKEILKSSGYQEAADKINLTDPKSIANTVLTATGFALFHGIGMKPAQADAAVKAKLAAQPPAPAVEPTAVKPVADDGEPPSAPAAKAATPAPPASPAPPPATVADAPTAEPVADIKAQLADMNDKSTPRTGVFLSTDNLANLQGGKNADNIKLQNIVAQATKQARTIDLDNGTLVVKTAKIAADAKAKLAAGVDPQQVIGELTGAGSGKTPEQTHVVQGQTPEGNVASESMVTPEEIPTKVAQMTAEGKTPVITTPEAAVARRATEVQNENTAETAAPTIESGIEQKAEPASPEPEKPNPRLGIFRAANGKEVGVHIEDGAAAGQLRVRPLDENGDPAKNTIDVPADAVKSTGKMSAPTDSEGTQLVAGPESQSEPAPTDSSTGAVGGNESGRQAPTPPPEAPKSFSEKLREKRAANAAVEPAPPVMSEEGAAPVAPPKVMIKARKPRTAFEALPEALAHHEAQEVPEEGKKYPASIQERQDNASAFAQVLKEAAKGAAGKASPTDIARASKAADAAIRFQEKSHEATTKGHGTSHSILAARIAEMHEAARALLGQEGKPVETPRPSGKLKLVKEKAATKPEPEPKAKEEPKEMFEVPVNPKYKDQIKEKEKLPAADDAKKANRLLAEYVGADREDLPAVRDKVEEWAHEQGHSQDKIDQMMEFLKEQRVKQNPNADARRMSDTLEPDQTVFDDKDAPRTSSPETTGTKLDEIKDKLLGKRMADHFADLARGLRDEGFFDRHGAGSEPIGTHDFLNRLLLRSVHLPALHEVITALRKFAPDLPIHMVDDIKNWNTNSSYGPNTTGLFDSQHNNIQVRTTGRGLDSILQTALHEITHAATGYELRRDPKGELATELARVRATLIGRLANKYGGAKIAQHLQYWKTGKAEDKPEGFMGHLYGISDTHEMLAELQRPRFMDEMIDSENHKSMGSEKFLGDAFGPKVQTKTTLLGRIYSAIAKRMGLEPKLLNHVVGLRQRVMEAQKENMPLKYSQDHQMFYEKWRGTMAEMHMDPMEQTVLRHSFEVMDEEPPPLRGVDSRVSAEVGEEPTKIARAFSFVSKGRVVDNLRRALVALKTEPQIFKTERDAFGHPDDPLNPINMFQDAKIHANVIMHKFGEITKPIAERWGRVSAEDNITLGGMLRDSTMYKIDPRDTADKQSAEAQDDKKFQPKYDELAARWNKMSPDLKQLYGDVIDSNTKINRELRRASIDAAIGSYTDGNEISPAQRALLYAVKGPHEFSTIIGDGTDHPINLGDRNGKLVRTLTDLSGASPVSGPYAHLGRHGDYVVSADPEGSRTFASEAGARSFVDTINGLSPGSRAKYEFRGGEHTVDYKAQYTSMHATREQAEQEAKALNAAGLNVGKVTQKAFGKDNAPLSLGMKDLLAEATRKINKGGKDDASEAAVESLKSAFVTMMAQRSAYAGSKLARRSVGGVKAEEMRQSYADHASSVMWHASQLRTVFEQAKAMAKMREAARDRYGDASQADLYRRGEVVSILGKHQKDEVANYGHKSATNAMLAKLGFASYLASPSHAAIWMTQNFTTGIPVAGARWGYGRSIAAHAKAMSVVGGPAFRGMMKAAFTKTGSASDIQDAVINAVRKSASMGKWAKGENSPLQQLIDRGIISHSYSNELAEMAKGGNRIADRAMGWARILPNMADAFNRVSSALAGLEMTGGDIRKTSEFVQEVHADYSQQAKPLAFKKLGRLPGANSITMFKTYAQAMIHLTYSNLYHSVAGGGPGRWEAAKTLAGVVAGNMLAAGVYGGGTLEVLKLAAYAYHKVMDDEFQTYDLQNTIHHFLVDHFGKSFGNLAAYGVPHAMGVDLSSRMGLGDLFFHNPPDLLTADKGAWENFALEEGGPIAQLLANNVTSFTKHFQKGELFQAISSVVPMKAYQDGAKALQLMMTGKQNSLGGQMTQASGKDAAIQAMGFKPASVAEAQEKAGTQINYNLQIKAQKNSVLQDVVSSHESPRSILRLKAFMTAHPVESKGMIRELDGLTKAQATTGRTDTIRDPALRKMLNF